MSEKRIDVVLDVLTQESTEFTNDPVDANKIVRRISQTGVKEITRLQMQVLGGSTVETVPLPDSETHYVIIYSDRQVKVQINGSDTPFSVIPVTSGKKSPVFFSKGLFTEVTVQNDETDTANLDVILVKL